jgi:hypothetical protein
MGAIGPVGPAGAKGERGATGAAASTSVSVASASDSKLTVVASCPAGNVATGGGFAINSSNGNQVVASQPVVGASGQPTGWSVTQLKANALSVSVTCIQ